MYCMDVLPLEQKWRFVIEDEGFSYEQFTSEFFRFITPALSSGGNARSMDTMDCAQQGVSPAAPASPRKKKRKKS